MRNFANGAPEYMEFTLGDSKKVHRLPLASSLPMSTLIELRDASRLGDTDLLRLQVGLLREYMGEVADTLTAAQVMDIYAAWNEESANAGATLGE